MNRIRGLKKVLIFVLLSLVILSGCAQTKNALTTGTSDSSAGGQSQAGVYDDYFTVSGYYVVLNIDTQEGKIVLRHLESGRHFMYGYNLGTDFLDKYGSRCSITKFLPGKVVEVDRVTREGIIEAIQITDDVWEYENIENYSIDTERGVFTIGQSNYQIMPSTVVFADNTEATFESVGDNDELRIIGKDKEVWTVSVTSGHGYISFVNTGLFDDSLICIGSIYTLLKGDMTVEVPEGIYRITAANNGYGGSIDIGVEREQTVTVDMDGLKGEGPKFCKIKFHVPITGARIYVDGKLIDATEELSVTYGKHALSVAADGYENWNKTLYVNSPTAEISLELSGEDKSSSSNNNNSSGNQNGNANNQNNNQNYSNQNNTGNNNQNSTGNNSQTGSGSNSSDGSSTQKEKTELDYLTTISDMLNILMNK